MGIGGSIGQIILLRESLVTFYGNEFSIGIILSNWLLLEAIGSFFIGRTADRAKNVTSLFVLFQILFSIFLPISIWLTRISRILIHIPQGEAVGLLPIFYLSLIILAPVSILHGSQFTYGVKVYSNILHKESKSVGYSYILETLGTMLGGIIFTYLFIPYSNSMQTSIAIASLAFLSSIFLAGRRLKIIPGVLLIISLFVLFSGEGNKLDEITVKSEWRGHKVLSHKNSHYGNICCTERGGEYTFFSDGVPIITTPTPDIELQEKFVHIPLLFHPSPKNILVISGAIGGVINEILKHKPKIITYVELDPEIIKMAKRYKTPLTEREIASPVVDLEETDGRLFVKNTNEKYDVILSGFSSPSCLQLNRFYTEEFFKETKRILKTDGILVITLPGSLTYLSEELKGLNGCVLKTLKEVYPYLRIIPGETNLYLASSSDEIMKVTEENLISRLKARKLTTRLVGSYYIKYWLSKRWTNWFTKEMGSFRDTGTNYDFIPRGVFYDNWLATSLFNPRLLPLFHFLERLKVWHIALFLTLLFSLFIPKRSSIPFAIFSTGLAGMGFDVTISLAFQCLYGYLYRQVGLLITFYMLGAGIGGFLITQKMDRVKNDKRLFILLELSIIIFALLLPIIFYLLRGFSGMVVEILFLFLIFVGGVVTGAEFPLSARLYLKQKRGISQSTGVLYASDLLGGFFGGLLISIISILVFGIYLTCFFIVFLKFMSLIFVTLTR